MRTHTVIDSPYDKLTLVAEGESLCGVYMVQQRHRPAEETFGHPDPGSRIFVDTEKQLKEYFAGQRTNFDLPLSFGGTAFQQMVWEGLLGIPYGETVSYGQLADRLGRPSASRAVGLANGKNPISIIVPCHRVIGSNGDLTGYGGGVQRKRQLLDFERGGAALF
ncbi:methylated-DNA-[protein]-cysteine S-methyltransferase [Amycolatopsis lurida]|uniref:Methylated-DNA--protein-cysteine methyltransferase n=1 Tax=Amycolatopsis lurida NRRL 2430 TaxID=1460371 RepID=A0A2P2G0C8_AMYLU|nr:methylated-DNA--[protein]-cysteine S-methyltransferase [Amycolatopsis lurida]KFU82427.1 cysteine methyltransferase [Amycolatopsis lurida NRRL 2430]SEB41993.1 methylated-DNA-[protein]-cysteine S-methyltransferase [Amycolatopsis lurida]